MFKNMILENKELKKCKTEKKEYWSWGNWISSEFDYLEERPWTPQVIDSQLCFSAKIGTQWIIAWGNNTSPKYDDAYDITNYMNKPLYIARNQNKYFLIWGDKESEQYEEQITFRIIDSKPEIYLFNEFVRGIKNPSSPIWKNTV